MNISNYLKLMCSNFKMIKIVYIMIMHIRILDCNHKYRRLRKAFKFCLIFTCKNCDKYFSYYAN